MDSARPSVPASPREAVPGAGPPLGGGAEAARLAATEERRRPLAALGRLLPLVHGLVRFCFRTAGASALAAALIVAALWDAFGGRAETAVFVAGGVLLLVPAGAAALLGWTLGDLLALPGQLRAAAVEAATGARPASPVRRSRLASVVRAVWSARALVLGAGDVWGRAFAAARLARLASLPFVLAALGLFVLNGLVVAGGLVAALALVLR